MAIFRLQIQSIGRATGRQAADVAAYRSGERLINDRSGAVYDYSLRTDVAHSEIVLPSRFASEEALWARDRQSLWNAAEAAERQRNSRFAREYQVSLPSELNAEQRQALAVTFSRDLADRYGVAVDLAIHRPPAAGDERNHHAHILTTTREVGAEALGRKSRAEWSDSARLAEGRPASAEEFKIVRSRWAELANESLREAGLEARIDSRSLAAQGIDREPKHLPYHVYKAAQRQLRPEVFERAKEVHRERTREVAATPPPAAAPTSPNPEQVPSWRRSLEDIQREARESWAALRAERVSAETRSTPESSKETSNATSAAKGRQRDDDLGL